MTFIPFHDVFPDIAAKQIQTIQVDKISLGVPLGEYGLVHAFCNEADCDCRRALVQLQHRKSDEENELMATMTFGWESDNFYQRWSPGMSDFELVCFKGPGIEPFQYQSNYASQLVPLFKNVVSKPYVVKRYISNYVLFKWKMGMILPKDLKPHLRLMDACPCGSGKPLKGCCV